MECNRSGGLRQATLTASCPNAAADLRVFRRSTLKNPACRAAE